MSKYIEYEGNKYIGIPELKQASCEGCAFFIITPEDSNKERDCGLEGKKLKSILQCSPDKLIYKKTLKSVLKKL